jgi:hypothetical protein
MLDINILFSVLAIFLAFVDTVVGRLYGEVIRLRLAMFIVSACFVTVLPIYCVYLYLGYLRNKKCYVTPNTSYITPTTPAAAKHSRDGGSSFSRDKWQNTFIKHNFEWHPISYEELVLKEPIPIPLADSSASSPPSSPLISPTDSTPTSPDTRKQELTPLIDS